MTRIALTIEYDGSAYRGWQTQNEQTPTVQSQLTNAVQSVAEAPVILYCAGRTDAGVHALQQVVHFDAPHPRVIQAWLKGVNAHLPSDIRVRSAKEVPQDFHARYSALARRYLYLVLQDEVSPGLLNKAVTWCKYALDASLMHQAAQAWVGIHDFSSFRDGDCQAKSPIRELHHFRVIQQKNLLVFDVQANAFLHHMVRNMVGTLLQIGRGKFCPEFAQSILEQRNRVLAPPMAPSNGLYLCQVIYPEPFQMPNELRLPWFLKALDKELLQVNLLVK